MEKENQNKKRPNPFIQFSGIAFQMAGTIYLGNYLGKWLDERYAGDGVYAKVVTLVAVFISIYLVISQVIRMSK